MAVERYCRNSSSAASNDNASTPTLEDKVIVITGSTGGIGKALCRVFATSSSASSSQPGQLKAKVIALDNDSRALGELQEEPPDVRIIVADHSDLDSVAAAADTINKEYGKVDILVNNAGIWYPFDDSQQHRAGASTQGYDVLFSVNYLSGFLFTELLLPLNCLKR